MENPLFSFHAGMASLVSVGWCIGAFALVPDILASQAGPLAYADSASNGDTWWVEGHHVFYLKNGADPNFAQFIRAGSKCVACHALLCLSKNSLHLQATTRGSLRSRRLQA